MKEHATWRALAAMIGEADAATLIERLGGRYLYIPCVPSSGSPLVLAIGHAAAARLCNAAAGSYLCLPSRTAVERHKRHSAILFDLTLGLSPVEVARRHGLTERHIRSIRRTLEVAP